jgi:mono/diheme cytochrome c family protein
MKTDLHPRPSRLGSALRAAVLGLLGGLLMAVAAVAWIDRTPASGPSTSPLANAENLRRGAYLARVGNCAGCHTARGGTAYAGGRGLATPFGTVYAGNLTPEPSTGLGAWTDEDFWRALHHGRSRDGRRLAPAFPYTEFTRISRADSDALHAFLRSLPPVTQATPASGLRFPFNTQAALAVWRVLYFRPMAAPEPTPVGRSIEWQRGADLVRGLGHCAACHAPRNALGAAQDPEQLAGGALPMQPWFAPSLAPRAGVPLATQRKDLLDLLRTGQSLHGVASGPMAEVVIGSTQHWSEADLESAATYLLSLPAQPAPPDRPEAAEAQQLERGAGLYRERCADCHGPEGEGAPGAYPALAGNPSVILGTPDNVLQVVRHGGFSPATSRNTRPYGMPPAELTAQQMADVLTHIRQTWGNRAPAVSVLQALRAP